MSTAAQVLAEARKDLGYYSPRPNGRSKFGIWYGDLPGVKSSAFDAAAWCAMAISYWAMKAKATDIIPVHAYTPSGVNWFKARGQYHTGKTSGKVGDIAYMRFSGSRVHHVGIVEKVLGNGRYQLIEGNTSGTAGGDQRNGGVVARKTRSVASAGIQGFGRPKYGSSKPKTWLERGDKGKDVELLQAALLLAGYDLGKAGVDGDFGQATEDAVEAFQEANGLIVDGQAGEKTWAALRKCAPEAETPAPAPEKPAPDPKPTPTEPKTRTVAFWTITANPTGETYSDGRNLGGGWAKRGPKVVKHLRGYSLVLLQEITTSRMSATIKNFLGKRFAYLGSRIGNDITLDGQKFKVLQHREIKIPGIAQNRAIKWAEIERGGFVLNVIDVHLPNASPSQRTAAAKWIISYVKNWQDPILIGGDVNNTSNGKDTPRNLLAKAGFLASRQEAKKVTNGDLDEDTSSKARDGKWLSDFFTRDGKNGRPAINITDVEMVEVPKDQSTHNFIKARVELVG